MFQLKEANNVKRTRVLLQGYGDVDPQPSEALVVFASGLRILELAGLNERDCRKLGMRSACICLAGVILTVVFSKPLILFMIPIYLFFEYSQLRKAAFRRSELFEQDYTAFLLSLASSVRSGLEPLQALLNARELFSNGSCVGEELDKVRVMIESGKTEEESIHSFGETVAHPDIHLFRSAFILARREGSALGDCLQRLARVTRHRQSFRRRSRAAVAMQRMSAYGIAGCAIIIGVFQCLTNTEAMVIAIHHPLGSKLLSFGCGLVLFGVGWMTRISRARI